MKINYLVSWAFGITAVMLIMAVPLSAQSLTITAPTASTAWRAGTTHAITWTIRTPNPSMGSVPVRLSYRVMPGTVWTEIGETEAFRQRYEWAIPPSVSGQVIIRAVWTQRVPIVVNSPVFRIDSTARGPGGPAASDYGLESVDFQDGRALSEGILYSARGPNDMRLLVRILWNKVPGRVGIQCNAHRLTIVDERGSMVLNPVAVPAPDDNGWISIPVRFRIPSFLQEDSAYSFRVRFEPADRDCDSIPANNERTFVTKLVRMGGNDLVVRIQDARMVWDPRLSHWDLEVRYDVMNVSGTEALRVVFVLLEIEGTSHNERIRFRNFRAGYWHGDTAALHHVPRDLMRRGIRVVVTVDPDNAIEELREDNNQEGKHFRFD